MNNPFEYNVEYTERQIMNRATPVNHQDEYIIAHTLEGKYWFVRSGHYWKLSHIKEIPHR